MIPFKYFAPALIGVTGIGWVISGIVQRPTPLTIKDLVKLSSDGRCIISFNPDKYGRAPKIAGCNGGGGRSMLLIFFLREIKRLIRLITFSY